MLGVPLSWTLKQMGRIAARFRSSLGNKITTLNTLHFQSGRKPQLFFQIPVSPATYQLACAKDRGRSPRAKVLAPFPFF
jgi:hypothetical protein